MQLFFLHIPKTAGTTLLSFIEDNISLADAIAFKRVRENFSATRYLDRNILQLANVVGGHMPPSIADCMRQPVKRVTVLRDPVALAISSFEHFKRDGFIPIDIGIKQYLESSAGGVLSNIQTRWIAEFNIPGFSTNPTSIDIKGANTDKSQNITEQIYKSALSNLRKYDYVGISEKLDITISTLRILLNYNVYSPVVSLNIAKYNRSYSQEIVNLIKSRNNWDMKLYQQALLINNDLNKIIISSKVNNIDSTAKVSRIFIDMDDCLCLKGFHQRELWINWSGVRWTTSLAKIQLNMEIFPNIEYVLKIFAISVISPTRFNDIIININGVNLNFSCVFDNKSFRYIANFKFNEYIASPEIEIKVPFAFRPIDVPTLNSTDSRELGVAVKWLYVGPCDDYLETVASLPPPGPQNSVAHANRTVVRSSLQTNDTLHPFEAGTVGTRRAKDVPYSPIAIQKVAITDCDRIDMTASCSDCAALPKVPNSGQVSSEDNGPLVQMMHEGTRVLSGGYYGEWMKILIQRLEGHHEPQEELLFHTLLKHARPGSLMVEFGCYWAYYSNWFLGAVPQSWVICIEPDENRMQVGQQNIQINQREAVFHVAAAGGQYRSETAFVRESDGASVTIPVWDCAKLLEQVGTGCIELLHMDTQGAELPFLLSIARAPYHGRLRFVVISTHHQSISGSATTHRDCLAALINMGAFVLSEHSVDESFSGDGLIVASFFTEDSRIAMPTISRNKPENSLFGPDPKRPVKQSAFSSLALQSAQLLQELDEKIEVAQTADGPMHIFKADAVIGASLKISGAFQTDKIDEVLGFLTQRFSFTPDLFVDIGANIGTHLVHALKACGFTHGLAFEPDPHNYALLTQNIAANGLTNKARAFKLALSSCSGSATFELCGSNFGDHRVRVTGAEPSVSFGEDQRQTISVLTDAGDDFFEENSLKLSSKTLIWVDTQGHEGHAFTGLDRQLSALQKPFIVCEFWPYGLERSGGKKMFFDFLSRCSVLYDINRPDWKNNSEYSLHRLEKLYKTMLADTKDGHYPHTDILCIL